MFTCDAKHLYGFASCHSRCMSCICLDVEWWKNELFPRCIDSLMHLGMFFGPWWRWYVCTSACVRAELRMAPCWMWFFRRPVYCAIILWYTPFSAAIAWLWACGRGDVTSRLLPSQPQLTERHKLVRSCLRAHPSRLVVPRILQWINHPFVDYCVVILILLKIEPPLLTGNCIMTAKFGTGTVSANWIFLVK